MGNLSSLCSTILMIFQVPKYLHNLQNTKKHGELVSKMLNVEQSTQKAEFVDSLAEISAKVEWTGKAISEMKQEYKQQPKYTASEMADLEALIAELKIRPDGRIEALENRIATLENTNKIRPKTRRCQ